MNLIRDIQNKELSRFLITVLAILFIFSLSIHNHRIGESANLSIESHSSSGHSVDDCSACLLRGNLQVPETGFAFNNSNFGLLMAYICNDFTVLHSFVDLNKPSRAPPTL